MSKLDWSKTSIPSNDPARVMDVGDYGILSDKLAGRKSGFIRYSKAAKKIKQPSVDLNQRAFPEAKDGRAMDSVPKAISKHVRPKVEVETTWSIEDIQVLTLLWNGGVPAKRIGMLVYKSRNAVIGKAKRLNLQRLVGTD